MKKFLSGLFSIFLFLSFMCLSLCGCGKNKSDSLKIVTSCYPIYIIVLNLTDGVEGIEVSNMSERHQGCLHDFQLESEDLKRIEKAQAFVINGAGMESFLEKVTKELPKVKIVDSSSGISLIEDEDCHDDEEEHHHHHHHHDYNPHIWVSIGNYIKQVENITEGLCQIDSRNKEIYQKNSQKYIAKLTELKDQMHNELDNVKNKNIVTFHEAFPYFAKEFGLNIVSVINHDPENEPSAKELKETIDSIKKTDTHALFVEPQYSSGSAEIISKETNAKIYTLDPAATGENSKDAYINIMKKNLEVLKVALN